MGCVMTNGVVVRVELVVVAVTVDTPFIVVPTLVVVTGCTDGMIKVAPGSQMEHF